MICEHKQHFLCCQKNWSAAVLSFQTIASYLCRNLCNQWSSWLQKYLRKFRKDRVGDWVPFQAGSSNHEYTSLGGFHLWRWWLIKTSVRWLIKASAAKIANVLWMRNKTRAHSTRNVAIVKVTFTGTIESSFAFRACSSKLIRVVTASTAGDRIGRSSGTKKSCCAFTPPRCTIRGDVGSGSTVAEVT